MMRLCTETVTVFNHRLNTETGDTDLYPAVLSGVSWFESVATQVNSSSGLDAATQVTVRIPEDADFKGKQYCSAQNWPGADPSQFFTLGAGDLIIKGAETGQGLTISDLQKKYGRVVAVLAVTDNRRAPRAKHWKVTGC